MSAQLSLISLSPFFSWSAAASSYNSLGEKKPQTYKDGCCLEECSHTADVTVKKKKKKKKKKCGLRVWM